MFNLVADRQRPARELHEERGVGMDVSIAYPCESHGSECRIQRRPHAACPDDEVEIVRDEGARGIDRFAGAAGQDSSKPPARDAVATTPATSRSVDRRAECHRGIARGLPPARGLRHSRAIRFWRPASASASFGGPLQVLAREVPWIQRTSLVRPAARRPPRPSRARGRARRLHAAQRRLERPRELARIAFLEQSQPEQCARACLPAERAR